VFLNKKYIFLICGPVYVKVEFSIFLLGGIIVWNVLRFCGDFIKSAGWVVTLNILSIDLSLCLLLWEMGHASFFI
jgi:hypothetical protein